MSLVKAKSKVPVSHKKNRGKGGKRSVPPAKKQKRRVESDDGGDAVENGGQADQESFQQSSLVSGGTLKGYQLEGVAWMATLWENGISGILGSSSLFGHFTMT